MRDTVAEVVDVAAREKIDADIAVGGTVVLARSDAQLERARAEVAEATSFGEPVELLDAAAARARVNATDVLGGTYTAHCAAVQPAKLVRGPGRRGRTARRADRRTDPGPAHRTRPGAHRPRHGVRRPRRAGDRGLHAPAGGPRAGRRAGLLADRRDRAAARVGVGRDRAARARDVQRLPAPDHLRPAHGGRPAGVRRARRAVPLPVDDPSGVRPGRAGLRRTGAGAARAVPGAARHRDHPPLGRPARHHPRLARLGRSRPHHRPGLGRRLRRRRGVDDQPGRAHARRPDHRAGHRADRAAVGRPPLPRLGTGAVALARRQCRACGP